MTAVNTGKYYWAKTEQPKSETPIAIAAIISATVAITTLIALPIIGALGVPLLPALLPISAFLIVGGSICAFIASYALRQMPKPDATFDQCMKEKKFDEAEEIIARFTTNREIREAFSMQMANHAADNNNTDRAIRIVCDRDLISDTVRESFLVKQIQERPFQQSASSWHNLIQDYIHSESQQNELRDKLSQMYLKEFRFNDLGIILQLEEGVPLKRWITTHCNAEMVNKYDQYEIKKAKAHIFYAYNHWLLNPDEISTCKKMILEASSRITPEELKDYLEKKEFSEEFLVQFDLK